MNPPILLFDDTCGLCQRSVRFFRDHASGAISLVGRETEEGRILLEKLEMVDSELDTLVLVDAEGVHTHSEAVLRLSATMRGPWPWVGRLLGVVPRGLRDRIYRLVARHRRRAGARQGACTVAGGARPGRMAPARPRTDSRSGGDFR